MRSLRSTGRAGLRLLAAAATLLASVQCVRLLLVPAVRSLFHLSAPAESLVRRAGILACVVAGYAAYVRCVEKRRPRELRAAPLAIASGAVAGSLLVAFPILLLFAAGIYRATAWHGLQPGLQGVAGLLLVAAVLEEIAWRGILFRILEPAWGTMPALAVESALFALDHVGNVSGHGPGAVAATLAAGTLLGAFWTMLFAVSRNLWVVAANHAAWNVTIVLSGITLSGIDDWRGLGLVAAEPRGPTWLTGGVFGPEGSVLTMACVAAATGVLLQRRKETPRHAGAFPSLPA